MPDNIVELEAKIDRAQEKLNEVRKFNHPVFIDCWELVLKELEVRMDAVVAFEDADARIIGEVRAIRLLRTLPASILGDAERSFGSKIKEYESRKEKLEESEEP